MGGDDGDGWRFVNVVVASGRQRVDERAAFCIKRGCRVRRARTGCCKLRAAISIYLCDRHVAGLLCVYLGRDSGVCDS